MASSSFVFILCVIDCNVSVFAVADNFDNNDRVITLMNVVINFENIFYLVKLDLAARS